MTDAQDPASSAAGRTHVDGPLVSVIVATNRSSPFLAEALESVARQTHPRVEVILVDDGNPDADFVPGAARALPGSTVLRQRASGVSVARNLGAARAVGDFLVFLDDDDRWESTRLAQQVASLIMAEDAVVGYCGMRSIDDTGATVAEADQVAVTSALDIARRATGIIMPNVMVRREAFEAVGGFSPTLRLAEDLDLLLRLASRGSFVFTDAVLVDYRAHPNNTTRSYRALCVSIDGVLRTHRTAAAASSDLALVRAYRESELANQRFAWWSAARSARENFREARFGRAAGDLAWATRFAPRGPTSALGRRLRRRDGGRGAK